MRNGVLGVSLNKLSPGKKIHSKNTMKNGVRNGHKNANFSPHKGKSLGPTVKKCSRLVLVKNTLQLVMENWGKKSKAELQSRVVYISWHPTCTSLV